MKLLFAIPHGAQWFFVLAVIAGCFFWIYTIVSIVKTKFSNDSAKLIWLFISIFLGFIGAVIYTIFGRPTHTNVA
ncbi:hypothetical protein BH11BAC5_BH11BAC5_06930 [soil metagenome]